MLLSVKNTTCLNSGMAATFLVGAQADILYHVLSHLATDLPVQNGGSVPFLWRSLPSQSVLEHLLCVLEIAQKPPKKHQWHHPQMELCGEGGGDDSSWTRFQEYASLVQKISINPFVHTSMKLDSFWPKLLAVRASGSTPILPRLEVVTLFSPDSFQYCAFDMGTLCLLNPSIRELNIVFSTTTPELDNGLRRALTACLSSPQDLKVLSLEVPIRIMDIETLPRLHSGLCQFKLDRRLCIHPDQLTLLASLPNLERLSFNLSPWDPTRPVAFKELRDLEVFSSDLAAIGSLLTHMDAPRLHSFSFSETQRDKWGVGKFRAKDLPAHLQTLATKWPALTAFEWHCNRPPAAADVDTSVGREAGRSEPLAALLAPLLSLRALRSFAAHFYSFVVPYAPADFRALAAAWPALESFRLCDDRARGMHPGDLGALVAFARGCPRLHTLHFPVLRFDPARDSDVASIAAVRQLEVERLGAAGSGGAHWLRELKVRYVIFPGLRREGEVDGTAATAALLQECMRKLFPSATLRYSATTASRVYYRKISGSLD
ncbi:hypothetical protein GSI_11457 [Ganoderma sinense ZZ0214-1]|uniref:F-box domain-containing protein n=1 Tax=Ganoderma sinense ZZ0214-1 TaxID=1077348 RepID=A0A2G8RW30_9APHY|nr:hypothetical protein GSI_11457 [Ganoderma sinense ZZ0214-1]